MDTTSSRPHSIRTSFRERCQRHAPSWDTGHQLFLSFNYATPKDQSSVNPVTITIKGPHPGGSDQLVLNANIQPSSPNEVLPTQMTWTVNNNTGQSTGIFGGATGQGTATLVYAPSHGGPVRSRRCRACCDSGHCRPDEFAQVVTARELALTCSADLVSTHVHGSVVG